MRDATYQPLEPQVVDRLTTSEGEFILYFVPLDVANPAAASAAATYLDQSERSDQ